MKTNHIILAACVVLNLGSNGLFAQAPAQAPSTAQSAPMTGIMNMSPEQCRDMMKKMGMSPAMMTRCQIMGNAQINAHDPAAVLALRSELGLTDAQVKDLEAIAATAQDQVKGKLTAEQLAILAPIAATPGSMMQFCQAMQSMTGKTMMGMTMCPMMPMQSSTATKDQTQMRMMCCPMMNR